MKRLPSYINQKKQGLEQSVEQNHIFQVGSLEGSSQSKLKFINARGNNESTQPPKTGVSSSEGRESEYFYSTPFQTDLLMFMCYLCKIKLIFLKYYDCVKSKGSEKEKKKNQISTYYCENKQNHKARILRLDYICFNVAVVRSQNTHSTQRV